MKTFATFAALTLVAVLLFAPLPAAGSTITECLAAIATLSQQTAATTFVGNKAVKVESQLQFHLSKASADLDKAELRDALRQMGDYESDLTNAANSGVVAPADAAALAAGAAGVISCIQAIGQ